MWKMSNNVLRKNGICLTDPVIWSWPTVVENINAFCMRSIGQNEAESKNETVHKITSAFLV